MAAMKKILLAVTLLCAMTLSGQASELEKAMESLGNSFKPLTVMAKAETIDFDRAAGLADKCLAAAEKAAKFVPKTAGKESDPEAARKAYADLQAQLLKDLQELKASITAKDAAAFKAGIEKLSKTRKQGHDRFKKD